MRVFTASCLALICLMQYKLWLSPGGVLQIRQLKQQMAVAEEQYLSQKRYNHALVSEISDLRAGGEAIEERARQELGYIKPDEVYYHLYS